MRRPARSPTQLMSAAGAVAWVDDESLMDAVTAVSGSGPAYFFLLAEALAEAGVAQGLAPAAARQLAVATLHGAGLMGRTVRRRPGAAACRSHLARRHHRGGAARLAGRRLPRHGRRGRRGGGTTLARTRGAIRRCSFLTVLDHARSPLFPRQYGVFAALLRVPAAAAAAVGTRRFPQPVVAGDRPAQQLADHAAAQGAAADRPDGHGLGGRRGPGGARAGRGT